MGTAALQTPCPSSSKPDEATLVEIVERAMHSKHPAMFYKKDVGPAKLTAPRDLFRSVRARIPDVRNQLSDWPVFNSKFRSRLSKLPAHFANNSSGKSFVNR